MSSHLSHEILGKVGEVIWPRNKLMEEDVDVAFWFVTIPQEKLEQMEQANEVNSPVCALGMQVVRHARRY